MISMMFNNLEDIEKQLYDFKILFAYHSNKIENKNIDFHNTRDIFEKGCITGYTGDLRTLFEIENQVQCYEYLKTHIVQKKDINIEFVKKIHYKLTKGTYDEYRYHENGERPGEFKKHDYVTGVNEVGSYPHEVEQHVKELIDEVNANESHDFITIAAYFHAMFEHIHPFADGNGRVGRTLLNYYLMIHDIAPIIIYNEDKKEYYQCLEQFDIHDNLKPLVRFITYQQEKTWTHKEKHKTMSLRSFL